MGDAGSLQVGDHVAVVGSPSGMEFTVTQGTVSSMDRRWLGLAYVQTEHRGGPGEQRRTDARRRRPGGRCRLPEEDGCGGHRARAAHQLRVRGHGADGAGAGRACRRTSSPAWRRGRKSTTPRTLASWRRAGVPASWGPRRRERDGWPHTWHGGRSSIPGRQSFTFFLTRKDERLCFIRADVMASGERSTKTTPRGFRPRSRHGWTVTASPAMCTTRPHSSASTSANVTAWSAPWCWRWRTPIRTPTASQLR